MFEERSTVVVRFRDPSFYEEQYAKAIGAEALNSGAYYYTPAPGPNWNC